MSEIVPLGRRLRAGSVTCETLTRVALLAIRTLEPKLNAFISVTEEQAIATARERDRELRAGRDRGALHGIPVVYKDCIDTAGVRTTSGSRIFRDRIPERNAAVVGRLAAAGAVMLGKSNMNELAAGGPGGYNKFYGSTRNPWGLEHESGGSSSGTGAAVAAGICRGGIGTDSGGSIRGPASHMGVVGLRPTIGRLDMRGVFPRAPSLDICGPLAASALDAAVLFDALLDERESSSIDANAISLDGIRLGIVDNYSFQDVQSDVATAVRGALQVFERLGATLISLRVNELEQQSTGEHATRILVYEFAREFGETYRAAADREVFGPVVHSDMTKAADVSPSDYESALRFKARFSATLRDILRTVDALVTPTMPTTAPLADKPDLSGRHRQFTMPVSLAGLPAISLPCGLDSSRLPIGLQLAGGRLEERKLLAIASAYEAAVADTRTRPPVFFDVEAELAAT